MGKQIDFDVHAGVPPVPVAQSTLERQARAMRPMIEAFVWTEAVHLPAMFDAHHAMVVIEQWEKFRLRYCSLRHEPGH